MARKKAIRNAKGQFVKGGSPGRPRGLTESKPRARMERVSAMESVITPDAIKRIFSRLLALVEDDGDTAAAKIILNYTLPAEPLLKVTGLSNLDIQQNADASVIIKGLLGAVIAGEISSGEAQKLAAITESLARAGQSEELLDDIRKLREAAAQTASAVAPSGKPPAPTSTTVN